LHFPQRCTHSSSHKKHRPEKRKREANFLCSCNTDNQLENQIENFFLLFAKHTNNKRTQREEGEEEENQRERGEPREREETRGTEREREREEIEERKRGCHLFFF